MIWDDYRKEIESIQMGQEESSAMIDRLREAEIKQFSTFKRSLHYRMGIVFVCVLLIVVLFVQFSYSSRIPAHNGTDKHQIISTNLPKIKLSPIESNGGYGIPALIEPDSSYLRTDNPWLGQDITHLPVYKNGIYTNGMEIVYYGGLSDEEMMERIHHYVETFALGALQQEDKFSLLWSFRFENGSVEVKRNGSVHILFKASKQQQTVLRKENTQLQNFDEAKSYSMLYADLFKEQLALKQPEPSVHVDYGYDYEQQRTIQNWTIGLYDKTESIEKDIVSYNFASYQFDKLQLGDEVEISIRINTYLRGDNIGEYPLISKRTAEEKFVSKDYQSLSPPPLEEISYMDVVYLFRDDTEYMIPFYRIYAPLKGDENTIKQSYDGFHTYGIYYICAIEEAYIE